MEVTASTLLSTITLCWLTATTVNAAGVDLFYPYGLGLDERLDLGDDVSSDELRLDMPIVFYSERKNSVWISSNGLVSFDGPLAEYKGDLFPLGREVIAPFYADVDTTSSGEVFYRESKESTELVQAKEDINRVFSPETLFEPASLLVVTWVNAASYRQRFETNTFQLVVATDGFRSFAIFFYLDGGIAWIEGDDKPDIPQITAQAGFDSGQQQYPSFVQPGSSFPAALNWNSDSNCKMPGVWMYQIGYLPAILQPDVERIGSVEPGDSSSSSCADECSPNGVCQGGCCTCKREYTGNGISCVSETLVRFSGLVTGNVNDNELENVKLHVAVVRTDGRAYTALSGLPPLQGYPMQLLMPLGELMGWLFAVGSSENGFTLTGAILNYTATITVGREVTVMHAKLNGVDDNGRPKDISVIIDGTLPVNALGSRAGYDPLSANYTKVRQGEYRSSTTRYYNVDDKDYSYQLDEVIKFNECKEAPQIHTVYHYNHHAEYYENELATRFVVVSDTNLPSDGSPCDTHDCHYNADCVPKGSRYTCTCKQGYEGSGRECQDLNECETGLNTCSANANCYNTDGGYRCTCFSGFSGDGHYCAKEENRRSCRDLDCHRDAVCEQRGDEPYCACKTGYRGDGKFCAAIVTTCNEADICDENADCIYNDVTGSYECQCRQGFSGDGESCDTPIDASCAYCSFNAQCVFNTQRLFYQCVCDAGYTGDGRSCLLMESQVQTTVAPTTEAVPAPGVTEESSCYYNRELCPPNSQCALVDRSYECVCNPGYLKSAGRCAEAACRSHQECGDNAYCQYDLAANRFQCKCNDGFQGDGQVCTSTDITTCNEVNVCHPDAECYDTTAGPRCVCRAGFDGDGYSCTPVKENCMSRPSMCDRNAVCTPTSGGDYVCICNPGYRGSGATCTAMNEKGNYLLLSQGMSVFRVPFYQAGSDRGRRILYRPGETLVGLAADCRDRKFFYSDISSGTISKASLDNSSDAAVIIDGLSSPEGLAVDWVSRLIFFTDSALDRIEVADLDGKFRKVIVSSGLVDPRAITVDPTTGKIYWVDWNRASPKIEVANADGTERRVLVDSHLKLPNGITYDYYRQQVCWVDAGEQKLECLNVNSGQRNVVYDSAHYPFSVTNFRDNFYWTDWTKKAIQSIPRGGDVLGSSILFPIGGNGKAYSIEPVPSQCLPGSNRCDFNNGGCKFLCLPTSSSSAVCACPDNINQDECNQIFRS